MKKVKNFYKWLKSLRFFLNPDLPYLEILTDTKNGSQYVILVSSVLSKLLPNNTLAESLETQGPDESVVYMMLVRSVSNGAMMLIPYEEFKAGRDSGRYVVQCLSHKEVKQFYDEEPVMESMVAEGGQLNATFSGAAIRWFTRSFGEAFMNHEAPNYIESTFSTPQGFSLTLNLQRHDGKTPHQLKAEAEVKVLELERQLEDLRSAV